jgi:hypothetical protein
VSVKDRWVGPHEVLNGLITFQRYVPGNPSSLPSTEGGFTTLTASMVALGEKLGMDPRIDQPLCYRLDWKSFFLGAVDLSNTIDDMKGCYAWTAYDMYGREPYVDQAWNTCGVLVRFPLQGVYRFERCDSHI